MRLFKGMDTNILRVFFFFVLVDEAVSINYTTPSMTYPTSISPHSNSSGTFLVTSHLPTNSSIVLGVNASSASLAMYSVYVNFSKPASQVITTNHTNTEYKRSSNNNRITPTPRTSVAVATSSIVLIPPKVTCRENSMEIELDTNMYSHLNSSSFHLRSSLCLGNVTGRTIKLSTPLNSCNTTTNQTNDKITYQNEVRAEATVKKDPITRQHALILPFNCTYNRRKYVHRVSFKPKRRVNAEEGAFGNFTFIMDLYSDSNYNDPYDTNDYPVSIQLNQRLYIKFRVRSDKGDLYVFVEKCLATTTPSQTSLPNYVFLDKGCKIDQTIVYNYKTSREQTLSIQAFRFIADHPVVYLHCLLLVCHTNHNTTSKCAVGCSKNSRKRRGTLPDKVRQESKLYHLSSGPITLKKITKTSPGATASPDVTVVALSSSVGVLLIGCFVLLVLLARKKRQNTKKENPSEPTELKAYDNDGVSGEDDHVKASNHEEVNNHDYSL